MVDLNKTRVPYRYYNELKLSKVELESLLNPVNIYHGVEPGVYDKYYSHLVGLAHEYGVRVINFNLVELIDILRGRSEEFHRSELGNYLFIGIEDFTFQDLNKLDLYDRRSLESFMRRNLSTIRFQLCLTEYETEEKTIFEKMIRKSGVRI